MPLFDLATIDRQHLIHCPFSFCRNNQKTHNFCPNSIKKRKIMLEIENLAQHPSHIKSLVPCYMALANASR